MGNIVTNACMSDLRNAIDQASSYQHALQWLDKQQLPQVDTDTTYVYVDARYNPDYTERDEQYHETHYPLLTITLTYSIHPPYTGTGDNVLDWRKDVVPTILALRKGWGIPAFKRQVHAYSGSASNTFSGTVEHKPERHDYDNMHVTLHVTVNTSSMPPSCEIITRKVRKTVTETEVVCH